MPLGSQNPGARYHRANRPRHQAEYSAGSVKRLIDARHAGTNPVKDLEQRILRAVQNAKGPITKRYVHQRLSRFCPSAKAFNDAFESLRRAELIQTRTEPSGRTWVWCE